MKLRLVLTLFAVFAASGLFDANAQWYCGWWLDHTGCYETSSSCVSHICSGDEGCQKIVYRCGSPGGDSRVLTGCCAVCPPTPPVSE